MIKSQIFFSIIIPVRNKNDYLPETKQKLLQQTYHNYELLVITDKISPNPCIKRNYGAKIAKGRYLCFLDDDSFPDPNWLKNIKNKSIFIQIMLHFVVRL